LAGLQQEGHLTILGATWVVSMAISQLAWQPEMAQSSGMDTIPVSSKIQKHGKSQYKLYISCPGSHRLTSIN